MKMVIRIDESQCGGSMWAKKTARAIIALLGDGHFVAIIHGTAKLPGARASHQKSTELLEAAILTKKLVCELSAAGLSTIGLWGSDGNLVRTRKCRSINGESETIKIAAVNAHWLDVMAEEHCVPVIANLACGPNIELCQVDAGELAVACAHAWHADALIVLIADEGVRDNAGSIIRWLEQGRLMNMVKSSEFSGDILSGMRSCLEALNCGVHRVRMLPLSHADKLAEFYYSGIREGTEFVLNTEPVWDGLKPE